MAGAPSEVLERFLGGRALFTRPAPLAARLQLALISQRRHKQVRALISLPIAARAAHAPVRRRRRRLLDDRVGRRLGKDDGLASLPRQLCLSASPYPASRRRNRPPCRFEALDMRYRGTRVARAMSFAPHDDEMTAAH